jgi:Tol biopolymer transport system component
VRSGIRTRILSFCALVCVVGCLLAVAAVTGISRLISPDPHEHSRSRDDMECSISHTGGTLVFNANGMGERDLYYADLVSHTVRRISATPEYETARSLSPDGMWIAYAAGKPGEREDQLYLRSVDGAVVRQRTSGSANICSPQFFPSGDRIMFTRDTDYHLGGFSANWDGGGSLWSVRTDGSGLRRLLPQLEYVVDPRLSPDGKWIVYMGDAIYVARSDGSGSPKKIAGADARYADFSPDSTRVVYVEGQYSTTSGMYIEPIAGGRPVRILGAPQGCFYPHFTPNGSQIIFQVEVWRDGGSGNPQFSLWRVGLKGAPAVQIAGPVLFADPERAHP